MEEPGLTPTAGVVGRETIQCPFGDGAPEVGDTVGTNGNEVRRMTTGWFDSFLALGEDEGLRVGIPVQTGCVTVWRIVTPGEKCAATKAGGDILPFGFGGQISSKSLASGPGTLRIHTVDGKRIVEPVPCALLPDPRWGHFVGQQWPIPANRHLVSIHAEPFHPNGMRRNGVVTLVGGEADDANVAQDEEAPRYKDGIWAT
jgi:hypothetical protein